MIDITQLTEDDIGRPVTYKLTTKEEETGFLKSWNDTYLFVVFKYDGSAGNFMKYTAQACCPDNLHWYSDTLYFRLMKHLLRHRDNA